MIIARKNPPNVAAPVGRYHHVAIVPARSEILAISGQLGLAPDGSLPDTIEDQLKNAFANIERILESEGLDAHSVFKINMWLAKPIDRDRYVEIWRSFHKDDPPATMFAYVASLIRPEYLESMRSCGAGW